MTNEMLKLAERISDSSTVTVRKRFAGGRVITEPLSAQERDLIVAALRTASAEPDGDETYEIGVRDGYEKAIQTLDMLTGGDGEFVGSTVPGRTVDVPVMQARIVERSTSGIAAASAEPVANDQANCPECQANGLCARHAYIAKHGAPSATHPAPDAAPAQAIEYARRLNDIAVTCELHGEAGDASDLRRVVQYLAAVPAPDAEIVAALRSARTCLLMSVDAQSFNGTLEQIDRALTKAKGGSQPEKLAPAQLTREEIKRALQNAWDNSRDRFEINTMVDAILALRQEQQ